MRTWAAFVVQRVAATLVVLVLVSFGVFSLLQLSPGSVEKTLLGTRPASPASLAAIREQYHLDDPFLVQYLRWAGDAVTGDLGTSIRSGEDVTGAIARPLPLTLQLAGLGAALAVLVGLPLGVAAALRRGRLTDRAIVTTSVVGVSTPPFAASLILLYVFAVWLDLFPVYGQGSGVGDRLRHLALPALALALANLGLVVRVTRAAMIRELQKDYIVFARGRGLSPWRTVRYALRNSLVPILTASGLILTSTLVGTVLVEVAFALPGLGMQLVDSVTFKDVPMVQAIALLLTLCIGAINLLVDIAYVIVDPRVASRRRTS